MSFYWFPRVASVVLAAGVAQHEWPLGPAALLLAGALGYVRLLRTGPGREFVWWSASAVLIGAAVALSSRGFESKVVLPPLAVAAACLVVPSPAFVTEPAGRLSSVGWMTVDALAFSATLLGSLQGALWMALVLVVVGAVAAFRCRGESHVCVRATGRAFSVRLVFGAAAILGLAVRFMQLYWATARLARDASPVVAMVALFVMALLEIPMRLLQEVVPAGARGDITHRAGWILLAVAVLALIGDMVWPTQPAWPVLGGLAAACVWPTIASFVHTEMPNGLYLPAAILGSASAALLGRLTSGGLPWFATGVVLLAVGALWGEDVEVTSSFMGAETDRTNVRDDKAAAMHVVGTGGSEDGEDDDGEDDDGEEVVLVTSPPT